MAWLERLRSDLSRCQNCLRVKLCEQPFSGSLTGECRFENFPECLNNPIAVRLGVAGYVEWFMYLERTEQGTHYRPCIYFKRRDSNIVRLETLYLPHHVGVHLYLDASIYHSYGKHIMANLVPVHFRELEIYALGHVITVEYGIQVESVKLNDGIWQFNFQNKLFDMDKKLDGLTFQCHSLSSELHCHKKLLKFHSQVVAEHLACNPLFIVKTVCMDIGYDSNYLDTCLQIANGVRREGQYIDYVSIIRIAERLKLLNVIRYCEQQMTQLDTWPVRGYYSRYKHTRYMVHSLKRIRHGNQLKEIYNESYVNEMSSEVMRMILHKFMEIEF